MLEPSLLCPSPGQGAAQHGRPLLSCLDWQRAVGPEEPSLRCLKGRQSAAGLGEAGWQSVHHRVWVVVQVLWLHSAVSPSCQLAFFSCEVTKFDFSVCGRETVQLVELLVRTPIHLLPGLLLEHVHLLPLT